MSFRIKIGENLFENTRINANYRVLSLRIIWSVYRSVDVRSLCYSLLTLISFKNIRDIRRSSFLIFNANLLKCWRTAQNTWIFILPWINRVLIFGFLREQSILFLIQEKKFKMNSSATLILSYNQLGISNG